MFELAELGRSYSKSEFSEIEPELRIKLFNTQTEIIKQNIPVVIIIAGIDGAGRGATVNMLSEWMDSKFIRNYTFWNETDEERMRPYAWRFWRKLPPKGTIGVYFGGWYSPAIRTFCCHDEITEKEFESLMHRWVRFERELATSGACIIKLWLHIDKKTFKVRMDERLKNDDVRHFSPYDKKSAENYDKLKAAAGTAIRITDRQDAPWTIIDAADANYRTASVARCIIDAVNETINKKCTADEPAAEIAQNEISALDKIDLEKKLTSKEYSHEYEKLKADIKDLTYLAYKKGISSTLVFEGWDAAGKGGAIRRLAQSIDARITQVIQVSAPTDEELGRHYLWRFWRNIPMKGFVTIYDRSWYGRVLVERVEGLASHDEWKRSYAEINDFEEQLTANGNILMKYWLHISPQEQLKRFRERETVEWKNYKITPDDWHNREKRPEYLKAADEMFARTSTDIALWHIVPAEDKKYARIEIMKLYRNRLEKALD